MRRGEDPREPKSLVVSDQDEALIQGLQALPDPALRKLIQLVTDEDGDCKFIIDWQAKGGRDWRDSGVMVQAQGTRPGCLIGKSMSAREFREVANYDYALATLALDIFPDWARQQWRDYGVNNLDLVTGAYETKPLPRVAVNRLALLLEHESYRRWPKEVAYRFNRDRGRLVKRLLRAVPSRAGIFR